ncbi:MAG: isoleucine--tRNA ligase [Actinobacteria bacterium]|nr:isoleucine--tRNA ligase [Actinomycetota bacterium]MBM3712787.1 isoleucine--tRNA ligase [Actinomycetota bacterium]
MFNKVESSIDLVKLEERILKFWKENKIFEKTLENTKGKPKFIFYEGPPTANGEPGVHHVISRVFKDLFPRYKTMRGFHVPRKAGWDTHGLPVEIEVEKQLGINSKKEIEKVGVEKFNVLCKESVMMYEEHWKKMTERIGFWVDMDNAYFTFRNDYIETVWWILKTIWDKNLLYEDYKIVPYCPRCGTALSSHEVAQGYRDIEDYSIIVKFPLIDRKNTFLLVWTTTPWTLISNVACAVNENAWYSEVIYKNENFILVDDLIGEVFGQLSGYEVKDKFKGSKLSNVKYSPVYKYTDSPDAFKVIPGDFVSVEDGTGIVHIAPAFGEDDMKAGRQYGFPVVQMVDEEGKFKSEVESFGNLSIEDSNSEIIQDLKNRNLLFKVQKYSHSYPFCWRCEEKLIYYAKKSWYIKTSEIKEELMKSNDEVNWYPEHIKYGRFGNWLENNVDWALSRERFWGTPLPIWFDKNNHKTCIGSLQELKEKSENSLDSLDLHKPFVDKIILKCPVCGENMYRTPEVIDVWFDSGAMPFAQFHYPFENREIFKKSYPADFICEAIDQTRGWFYTMLAISTLLYGKSSFKNVLCLGLINDEYGQKMSKSRGNVVKPWDILNKQGADALRWYFFTAVSPWNAKNFSVKAVDEVVRKFILTLWNTYSFFVIYANIDNFNPYDYELDISERFEIDRWIISELNYMIKKVIEYMDNFNVTDSGRLIENFVDDLSNWYVRRSRRRFWKSESDKDKISAYKTLYECLLTISKIAAPYIPFICEEIYTNLAKSIGKGCQSVHLERYPEADDSLIDWQLSFRMKVARKIVGLGRSVRSKLRIKTRQPLARVKVYFDSDEEKMHACMHFKELICEELNVKELEIVDNLNELVSYSIKPNLKLLGPKYGQLLPKIKTAIESENQLKVALRVKNAKSIDVIVDKRQIEILPEEVLVDFISKEEYGIESDGEFTVGMATSLTEKLREEGFLRELVHQIQNLRKEANFQIENTIITAIQCDQKQKEIIERFRDYIMKETLSEKLTQDFSDDMFIGEIKINGFSVKVGIKVIGSII